VADIKDGQALVQRVVEAVVTSPQFVNTLLIITYDEHGGFYDHVPPPPAIPFSDESPIKTYGVRVPAFFISPWIKAGGVFGNGNTPESTLHFDHTSILKTIARRFLSKDPPYMGRRYAAAKDLIPVLDTTFRRFKFLPFIRYNMMYNASQKMLEVQLANSAPGTVLWQSLKNDLAAQDFSIEEKRDFVYIRTHTGNLYLTVDVPAGQTIPPDQGFGIKQDVKYEGGQEVIDPATFNSKYQLWKLKPTGTTAADKNMYTIINAAFPDRVLQPINLADVGALIVLARPSAAGGLSNAWMITSPVVGS